MPWGKKQATAILMKAKRSGDTGLARKAKSYLKKPAVVRAQRRK